MFFRSLGYMREVWWSFEHIFEILREGEGGSWQNVDLHFCQPLVYILNQYLQNVLKKCNALMQLMQCIKEHKILTHFSKFVLINNFFAKIE